MAMFQHGQDAFNEVEDVPKGLGPRFNLDSCGGCHAQPTAGGSSPAINPQIAVASKGGAMNSVPPFIQPDGPVRVVRFRRGPDGRPDGGVHDLFVISGRGDAPSTCSIQQPDFSQQRQNLSFRIPTPVFGLGLVESIADSTLIANLAANGDRKQQLDIQGRFNTNGNDGTITRFGWKAQNKSLTIFSGEAYNVEVGIYPRLHRRITLIWIKALIRTWPCSRCLCVTWRRPRRRRRIRPSIAGRRRLIRSAARYATPRRCKPASPIRPRSIARL
jgi:hypothetical protein